MPLPLTVSCFCKIRIGFTFLVPAHLGSPGKGLLNARACVCVCVCLCVCDQQYQQQHHLTVAGSDSAIVRWFCVVRHGSMMALLTAATALRQRRRPVSCTSPSSSLINTALLDQSAHHHPHHLSSTRLCWSSQLHIIILIISHQHGSAGPAHLLDVPRPINRQVVTTSPHRCCRAPPTEYGTKVCRYRCY